MDTIDQSINNLTALWMAAGRAFQSYHQKGNLHSCYISGSDWPNRMWCKEPFTETERSAIIEKSKENRGLILSYFDKGVEQPFDPEPAGLHLRSEQAGMHLLLNRAFEENQSLQFQNVNDERGAQLWAKAFQESFSYRVSTQTILRTHQEIPYSLVYDNDKLIGTVILFQTGKTAGIHCLGVLPEMRKNGYAREIMHHVLNKAIENGAVLAVLQASEMAKDIYIKMGFKQDFKILNYQFKPVKDGID